MSNLQIREVYLEYVYQFPRFLIYRLSFHHSLLQNIPILQGSSHHLTGQAFPLTVEEVDQSNEKVQGIPNPRYLQIELL